MITLQRPYWLLLAALLVSLLGSCRDAEQGVRPRRGTLTEAVYATAVLEPRESYTAFSSVAGILANSLVEEGRRVRKGAPLFEVRGVQADLER
jgi:HlyD family secretion protein